MFELLNTCVVAMLQVLQTLLSLHTESSIELFSKEYYAFL